MWSQMIMALLGIWLMIAPGVFDFEKKIANNAHIVGPLIASFSIIAIWECTRNVRLINLPLALWLLAAPWIINYQNTTATINDYAVAILVLLLCAVKIKRRYRFGGGWPSVWRSNALHAREAANRSSAITRKQ